MENGNGSLASLLRKIKNSKKIKIPKPGTLCRTTRPTSAYFSSAHDDDFGDTVDFETGSVFMYIKSTSFRDLCWTQRHWFLAPNGQVMYMFFGPNDLGFGWELI